MEPVLTDTSVWIDFFRGRKTRECALLYKYIEENGPLLVCPPIIREILQGIRNDDDYIRIKDDIFSLAVLIIDPVEAAIGSADLYRRLRKKGITIKKTNDCLIAYYAIYHKVYLLHRDSDFDRIAGHSSLKIKEA